MLDHAPRDCGETSFFMFNSENAGEYRRDPDDKGRGAAIGADGAPHEAIRLVRVVRVVRVTLCNEHWRRGVRTVRNHSDLPTRNPEEPS